MIVSNAIRTHHVQLKLIVAFALIWSFLMPTIDKVVTPVSSSLPAVSSGIHGCMAANASGHSLEKPEDDAVCLLRSVVFFPLSEVASTPRLRFSYDISLLMKSLLLRPIKFTSNYVAA